jgi:hypothetical protein
LLFSHTQDHIYAHGATEIRKKATFAFQKLTNCSIGHDIPFNKWYNNIINSKYVLVVRGDTPGSHSFINAIVAGCIPIIISDSFQYCSTPFNDVIKLEYYSITISEKIIFRKSVRIIEYYRIII